MHWTRRTIPSRDETSGEHNAGVPSTEQRRPRFRIRLSTLMLLIIIVGLSIALVMGQRRRVLSEELARANQELAEARALQARWDGALVRGAQDETKRPIPRASSESPDRPGAGTGR